MSVSIRPKRLPQTFPTTRFNVVKLVAMATVIAASLIVGSSGQAQDRKGSDSSKRTTNHDVETQAAAAATALPSAAPEIAVPEPINVGELEIGQIGMRSIPGGVVASSELPNLLNLRDAQRTPINFARHYLVQLDGPMTDQRRATLTQLGLTLSDYVPMNSWIVRLPVQAQVLNGLADTGFVIWVGEYQDQWKLDPDIGQHVFVTAERVEMAARGDVALDVTLFEGEDPAPVIATINAVTAPRAVHIYRTEDLAGNPTITLTMPLADVPQLALIDAVQYVEEVGEMTQRNDTVRWIVQSNVSGLFPLYNAGIHGENQVVGHMDGRVNQTHCSFRDTVNPIGPLHRKILAYNTTAGYDQHGTHTAGTAVGDNFTDVGNTRGVAYLAKLVHGPIPSFTETSMLNAFQNAHNQTARVHTNSWGNDGTTAYDAVCRGLDNFQWINEDSLIFFAVTNLSTLRNPENAKNLVAVGASQDTPSQASFCSGGSGPTNDQRRKPEIYSPGCGTTSSSGSGTVCTVASLTGTSMACPSVTGAAALVRQYYTAGYYPTGAAVPGNALTPTAALIKATLMNAAVDMTGIAGYPSNQEGWGRLLADEALYFTGEARKLAAFDVRKAVGLTTGAVIDRTINVSTSTPKLKVTLVWTEPPATSGANPAYINNLDLEVIAPGGATYLGNMFSGGISVTGGTADIRNNVEQVHLNTPAVGAWTIRVKATAVNTGPQGYALVVSGDVSTGPAIPSNDLCANATLVGAGATAFSNVGAMTDGPDEPGLCNFGGYTHIGKDVWYKFLAGCTGTATVSLCGANYNTKMAAYGACPVGAGAALACNDDFCGTASEITFPVNQGTVYRVRIGGNNGASGSGTMNITCTPAPQCPADATNDGQVNVNDLLLVINSWGSCPGCPADVTGDGQVNVNDLLMVINNWGPCP